MDQKIPGPNFCSVKISFTRNSHSLEQKRCYKLKTVSRLGLNDTTLISWWKNQQPICKICSFVKLDHGSFAQKKWGVNFQTIFETTTWYWGFFFVKLPPHPPCSPAPCWRTWVEWEGVFNDAAVGCRSQSLLVFLMAGKHQTSINPFLNGCVVSTRFQSGAQINLL